VNIAYVRVSSADQNTARQLEALKNYNIDKYYEEKISGKDTNRPMLKAMLEFAREGDTVYIESISRLARNTLDFLKIVEQLTEKGIKLISLKESIDTSTPQGKFMLSVFAALSQLERDTI
jgi:DNA invertase Pin-like site-specific DNA recombinase